MYFSIVLQGETAYGCILKNNTFTVFLVRWRNALDRFSDILSVYNITNLFYKNQWHFQRFHDKLKKTIMDEVIL